MQLKFRTPLLLAAGMLLGAGMTVGFSVWAARAAPGLPWQSANLFAEVYERVRRDYIQEIPDARLMDSAVRGLVSGLDQYSAYLDEKEFEEMRLGASGAYSGVGIEIAVEAGQLKVMAALDDSPAARAGVRAGDVVIAVDDVEVEPEQLDRAVERMRGKSGERVKLTVRRASVSELLTFDLVRRKVQVHSVKAELLEPGFGYLRISQFSETTADDFTSALDALQARDQQKLRGLVLDLRNNPGGVLEAAVAVADAFLEEGPIVNADGRAIDARFEMSATPGDALNGAPIAVLVNSGSASASEIVAGALKDRHRALLLGQTTYGKGSVQSLVPLAQGGALKLTTSLYHTPSGVTIHERGIAPDVTLGNVSQAPPAAAGAPKLLVDDAELRIALESVKTQARVAAEH